MEYKFCINDFEGPLDLLLHLVKTSKMDIYEIDIHVIIEEYLAFLEQEKSRNIDIASHYLVMAAELIHLKSKMLVNINLPEEESNEEFSITSEEDLRRKILEYEKYKKLTKDLEDKFNNRNNYYTKAPMNLEELREETKINFGELDITKLVKAFEELQKREKLSKPLNTRITRKEYSIDKRINDIRKILLVRDKVEFWELFSEKTPDFLIVTFLSILTMCKNEEVTLLQENNFQPIMIERRVLSE